MKLKQSKNIQKFKIDSIVNFGNNKQNKCLRKTKNRYEVFDNKHFIIIPKDQMIIGVKIVNPCGRALICESYKTPEKYFTFSQNFEWIQSVSYLEKFKSLFVTNDQETLYIYKKESNRLSWYLVKSINNSQIGHVFSTIFYKNFLVFGGKGSTLKIFDITQNAICKSSIVTGICDITSIKSLKSNKNLIYVTGSDKKSLHSKTYVIDLSKIKEVVLQLKPKKTQKTKIESTKSNEVVKNPWPSIEKIKIEQNKSQKTKYSNYIMIFNTEKTTFKEDKQTQTEQIICDSNISKFQDSFLVKFQKYMSLNSGNFEDTFHTNNSQNEGRTFYF